MGSEPDKGVCLFAGIYSGRVLWHCRDMLQRLVKELMWSYALDKSLFTVTLNKIWKDFSKWIVIVPLDDSIDSGSSNPMAMVIYPLCGAMQWVILPYNRLTP